MIGSIVSTCGLGLIAFWLLFKLSAARIEVRDLKRQLRKAHALLGQL